jgi:hypothetical protein
MATYYTKAEARSFASTKIQKSATRDSRRILQEEVRAATNEDRFDIFLSHASKDGDLILGVKSLLESFGFKVYVDWVDDPQLDRSKVSKETADLLRRRLRQSTSLVWAATEAASDSKWMPWELGYFDGFRPNQVAILPLVDNASDAFKGQEYIALYPVIRKDAYKNGNPDVFVEDPGEKWTTVKSFGSGTPIWSKYGG